MSFFSNEKKYLFLFFLTLGFFFFFRFPYREFIYTNGISDYHIADTAPNFFGVFLFVFLKKSQKKKHSNILLCSGAFLGMIAYEYVVQPFVGFATVDFFDLLASLFASLIVFSVCNRVDTKQINCDKLH